MNKVSNTRYTDMLIRVQLEAGNEQLSTHIRTLAPTSKQHNLQGYVACLAGELPEKKLRNTVILFSRATTYRDMSRHPPLKYDYS